MRGRLLERGFASLLAASGADRLADRFDERIGIAQLVVTLTNGTPPRPGGAFPTRRPSRAPDDDSRRGGGCRSPETGLVDRVEPARPRKCSFRENRFAHVAARGILVRDQHEVVRKPGSGPRCGRPPRRMFPSIGSVTMVVGVHGRESYSITHARHNEHGRRSQLRSARADWAWQSASGDRAGPGWASIRFKTFACHLLRGPGLVRRVCHFWDVVVVESPVPTASIPVAKHQRAPLGRRVRSSCRRTASCPDR